jgi:replicative DNA helicase
MADVISMELFRRGKAGIKAQQGKVLAACMVDINFYLDAAREHNITIDSFESPVHKDIWRAIGRAYEETGYTDVIAVYEQIKGFDTDTHIGLGDICALIKH